MNPSKESTTKTKKKVKNKSRSQGRSDDDSVARNHKDKYRQQAEKDDQFSDEDRWDYQSLNRTTLPTCNSHLKERQSLSDNAPRTARGTPMEGSPISN